MGTSLFSIRNLILPFQGLEERYVTIPAGQTLSVSKDGAAFRLIYFLGDSLELELPDGTKIKIEEGDAISLSEPWLLRYRSLNPAKEICNNILAVRFSSSIMELWKKSGKKKGFEEEYAAFLGGKMKGFRHFPAALQQGGGRDILQLIRKEAKKKGEASRWQISGLCLALVSGLLAETGEAEPEGRERGPALVEHACHYMRDHCHENLTLARIAWHVQLSGEHLERLFKKHVGVTVFEYLDTVRLEKARQLLLTTDWAVVRIAVQCGYSSSSLLGRHFKAREKLTPMAYRLRARSGESFSPSRLQST